MSVTDYVGEPEDGLWERYLSETRALSEESGYTIKPSLRDFAQWLSDQDIDLDDNVDWEGVEASL